MRFLMLLTDAFGGKGGIALHNRDLLTALCAYPDCEEVVAIPRLMPSPMGLFPPQLTYVTEGVGSKWKYILVVLKTILKDKNFDLIICGHINLLPLGYLLKKWTKTPLSA